MNHPLDLTTLRRPITRREFADRYVTRGQTFVIGLAIGMALTTIVFVLCHLLT